VTDDRQVDLVAAQDPLTTTTVGLAGRDHRLLRRIATQLQRDEVEVAGLAPDARELVLECADMGLSAAVCVVTTTAELENDAKTLRRRLPDTHLVAVLREMSGAAAMKALALGFTGVVREREASIALAPTVRAVCAGQVVAPRQTRGQVARHALTERERAVMRLLQQGLTNAEIAARLFLAESTVKGHISLAFSKLGVRSRKEALELELLPDDDEPDAGHVVRAGSF
jgi:two-component system response regulator DevR